MRVNCFIFLIISILVLVSCGSDQQTNNGKGTSTTDKGSAEGSFENSDSDTGSDSISDNEPATMKPECAEGEKRCVADKLESCSDGKWTPVEDCSAQGKICSDRGCVLPEPQCGNGVVEEGETCDGGKTNCSKIGDYEVGIINCLEDCSGWETDSCKLLSRANISGNVALYHPSDVPGFGNISEVLGVAACDPVDSMVKIPYGSLSINVSDKPVASTAGHAPEHDERFLKGVIGSMHFDDDKAASKIFMNSGELNVFSSGKDDVEQKTPSVALKIRMDSYSKTVVGIQKGQSFIYVYEKEQIAGSIKCLHAVGIGELSIDYEDASEKGEGNSKTPFDESNLDFTGPVYEGDTVLAINVATSGESIESTGTIPMMRKSGDPIIEPLSFSDFVPGKRIPVPEGVGSEDVVRKSRGSRGSVGDRFSFYVSNDSNNYSLREAELLYVGKRCEVWSTEYVDRERAGEIGEEFDTKIFDLITENFYRPQFSRDKVGILLTDLGQNAAGYFSPADFFERDGSTNPHSNNREIVYLTTNNNYHLGKEVFSTLTHEFQHLVHNKRNVVEEEDYGTTKLPYRWIDEGLAVSSEHLFGGVQYDRLLIFNENYEGAPGNGHSLLHWDYYDYNKVPTNYSLAYFFFQYLRIQAGQGADIYSEIIECRDNDYRCVEQVVHKYIDENKSFADFMVDFRLALLINSPEGPYGFKNEEGFEFVPSYFNGSSTDLRGGGAIYIHSDGNFQAPTGSGDDIRFVGVKMNNRPK